MAPGSVASSDSLTSSASLTSTSSTSGWSGIGKPGPSSSIVRVPRRHPPVLRMVLEALQAGEQRRGTSVVAIKVYILQKYPTVDAIRLKYLLKRALNTGMQRGLLARPTNSKAKGATGSFKLVPKPRKKVKPRKKSTMSAPRRPAEAKEEAPKKGGQTKDGEARVGKARKVPQEPDKATKGPRGPIRPRGKSKVKGRKNSPADDKAHRKTKAGTQSSKATVAKGENGAVFPAKKMTGSTVPKEAAAQGAGQRPKAKGAAAPPKDGVSKTVTAPPARKTEVPKGPGRPGVPAKALSSNGTSKKIEAKS
ncbi:histone H1.8 [Phyllostomus hastatus]|uniref:histone H1.8 n=1 Tax=Phyllostomus hastatus TaxID=9423 RepID=UPI001E6824EA|nr:histone H1.8 [Phyllostomus hastatus]